MSRNKNKQLRARNQYPDQQIAVQSWTSPLPPPQVMQQYMAADPKFVEMIMKEIEKEADSRRSSISAQLENQKTALEIQKIATQGEVTQKIEIQRMAYSVVLFLLMIGGASLYFNIPIGAITSFGIMIGMVFWGKALKKEKND